MSGRSLSLKAAARLLSRPSPLLAQCAPGPVLSIVSPAPAPVPALVGSHMSRIVAGATAGLVQSVRSSPDDHRYVKKILGREACDDPRATFFRPTRGTFRPTRESFRHRRSTSAEAKPFSMTCGLLLPLLPPVLGLSPPSPTFPLRPLTGLASAFLAAVARHRMRRPKPVPASLQQTLPPSRLSRSASFLLLVVLGLISLSS